LPVRLVVLVLALCASCSPQRSIRPFTTDGCSLFPDGALTGSADWCACCVAHDLAYWRGGTEAERFVADKELRSCVLAATGDVALANNMLAGVRIGGTPHLPTSFRWGYGWPYDRGYKELTPDEKALAEETLQTYGGASFCDR